MTFDKTKDTNSAFEAPANITGVNLRHTVTNTQNITLPNTVSGIWVHMAGGGSGGTGRINANPASGFGGSGGVGLFGYTSVTPGSTVGITIGAGGAGGVSNTNVVDANLGGDGGTTSVNTTGTCWKVGSGERGLHWNTPNQVIGNTSSGKMFGVTRQQIIFTPRETSPRISVQWPYKEGISPGGTHQNLWQYSTATVVTRTGGNSIYGGGGGGGAGGQFSNLAGAPGGNSLFNSNTGGAGANYALANSGAGGGGAGIAGNGGAGSGNTGGAGGSGGGGGGGGGIVNANVGTGGAGGSGAVLIYY